MRLGLFGRNGSHKAESAGHAARIKADLREILDLTEDTAIAVNEILCADPACPGTETVILVMEPGRKTIAFKAQTGMADLTRDALAAIVAG